MDVARTIKKARTDGHLKQLNVTSVANVGILPRSASVLALKADPRVVTGKSPMTIMLSTLTTSINITITTGLTGLKQSIMANTTEVRRHMGYRSPVVLRVTIVTNVLPAHPATAKMRDIH